MWLSKKVHWQYVSHQTTNTGGWMPNSFEPFMWSVHHLAINIAVIVNCPLSTEKSLNRLKHREPFSRIINRTELQRYYQIKPKLPYCRAYVCVCVFTICVCVRYVCVCVRTAMACHARKILAIVRIHSRFASRKYTHSGVKYQTTRTSAHTANQMNDTERNIQYHTLAFLTLELFVLMIHSVLFYFNRFACKSPPSL